ALSWRVGSPSRWRADPGGAGLPADGGHRARRLDKARLAHVVLELLAPHGVANDGLELGVGGAVAHRCALVGPAGREQARAQPAVRGQADAVAVTAEWLGDRVDEADPALAIGEAVDARGRAGLARLGFQRVHGIDRGADLGPREHLVHGPAMVGVEGHELDEADLV